MRTILKRGLPILQCALLGLAVPRITCAQDAWSRSYGGPAGDVISCIIPESDGGFVAVGTTESGGLGGYDGWVQRLDSTGAPLWSKAYGGALDDYLGFAERTADGGFILCGTTKSFGAGWHDAWILRLNGSGDVLWQQATGGLEDDYTASIRQCPDGGYLAAGMCKAAGRTDFDGWVIKIGPTGERLWQKRIGGSKDDGFGAAIVDPDGTILLAGATESAGEGEFDGWLVKLDPSGQINWERTFGGVNYDGFTALGQDQDGGYFAGGATTSFGSGFWDAWLLKVDRQGSPVWERVFGHAAADGGLGLNAAPGGGCIVAGGYGSPREEDYAAWVLSVGPCGDISWEGSYPGQLGGSIRAVGIASGGGVILGGTSYDFGAGQNDGWVLMGGGSSPPGGGCLVTDEIKTAPIKPDSVSRWAASSSFPVIFSCEDIPASSQAAAGTVSSLICPTTCAISCYATVPTTSTVGATVSFKGQATVSGSCGAVTYEWTFGDSSARSAEQNPNHVYARAGLFKWRLIARSGGLSCVREGEVVVPYPGTITLSNGQPYTAVVESFYLRFKIPVPPGAKALTVRVQGPPTGDNDMYGVLGNSPTPSWNSLSSFNGNVMDQTLCVTAESNLEPLRGGDWYLNTSGYFYPPGTLRVTATFALQDCQALECVAAVPSYALFGEAIPFEALAFPAGNCAQGVTYRWDFGDGTAIAEGRSVNHAYSKPGPDNGYTFYWHLTATAGGISCARNGCVSISSSTCLTCQASVLPKGGFDALFQGSATYQGCTPRSVYWSFGDGAGSEELESHHAYERPGVYIWAFEAYSLDTQWRICNKKGILVIPELCVLDSADAIAPTEGRAGDHLAFQASALPSEACTGGLSCAWDFGDGMTGAGPSIEHAYATGGVYNWSVTISSGSAVAVRCGQITIGAPCLSCSAAVPASATVHDPVTFLADFTIDGCTGSPTLAWDFGDGAPVSDQQNPVHEYQAVGLYAWTLTVTLGGSVCTRTGTIDISSPLCALTCSAIATPAEGPVPLAVSFTAVAETANCSGAPSFFWDFGDGTPVSDQRNPTHAYLAEGVYIWTLTVSVEGQACTRSGSIKIDPPPCRLTCSATVIPKSGLVPLSVSFSAAAEMADCSGGPSFSWDFGDGAASSEQNPVYVYNSGGEYVWTLTVSVGDKTCLKSGTVEVKRIPGDCDNNGRINIGEVQKAIAMFLGTLPPDCGTDCTGDGIISIGELQKVLNAYLGAPTSC